MVCTPMRMDACIGRVLDLGLAVAYCKDLEYRPARGNAARAMRRAMGTDYGYQMCWRPGVGT